MYKFLVALTIPFVLSSQGHASAFDSLNDQKLQEQAFGLLEKNAAAMSLNGDILPSEKLTDILKEVQDYNQEIMNRLSEGRDIENLNSPIDHTDTKCKIQQDQKSAICHLTITYRPIGETDVQFTVALDGDSNAVAIGSRALVSRGD